MHGILLMLVALTPSAGNTPLRESSEPANAGEVASNKPLVHVFELENTGAETINIADVRRSCSCAKVELVEKTISPGRKISLKASFNLTAQPAGPGRWTVTVVYMVAGSDQKIELPLSVAGKVRRDVWTEPVSLVMTGEANLQGSVTVYDRRGKPLNVTGVRMGVEQARTTVIAETKGDKRQTIRLVVAETMPVGSYLDEMSIDTDDPEYRELKIPVRIVKKKPDDSIRASVSSITLRGAGASKLVTLRDKEDREIEIESLTSDEPGLSLKWAKGPGSDATIRITLDEKTTKTTGMTTVVATTKLPVARTIAITLEWSK